MNSAISLQPIPRTNSDDALRRRVLDHARVERNRLEAGRNSLLEFTRQTKPGYIIASHNKLIAERLDAVMRGEIKRLMIFTPPRHGKSELVSRRFPALYLGRFPAHSFIAASYGGELALDVGRDVRNLCMSTNYARLFPRGLLSEDSRAKDRWHTQGGGSYLAAGVGMAMTGHGANILDIDDPVKGRAEAESQTIREATWAWYRSVAYTRLQPNGAIVLTMTRWHPDDLAGRLLEAEADGTGDKWEKLVLPALDTEGNALWAEMFPVKVLEQIHAVIGEPDWQALYMQRPQPPGGSFFSVDNLLVDGAPVESAPRYDAVFAVLDTAVKTGNEHDGLGCIYFARSRTFKPALIVLDYDLRQVEGAMLKDWLPNVFTQLETLSRDTHARMGSAGVFIEDKASGMVLLQQAAQQNWPARAIDSKLTAVGKSERAINISGHVYAGEVKLARAAYDRVLTYKGHTRNHLLSQVLGFRAGTRDMAEDDLLDCFSYGVALGLGSTEGF